MFFNCPILGTRLHHPYGARPKGRTIYTLPRSVSTSFPIFVLSHSVVFMSGHSLRSLKWLKTPVLLPSKFLPRCGPASRVQGFCRV